MSNVVAFPGRKRASTLPIQGASSPLAHARFDAAGTWPRSANRSVIALRKLGGGWLVVGVLTDRTALQWARYVARSHNVPALNLVADPRGAA